MKKKLNQRLKKHKNINKRANKKIIIDDKTKIKIISWKKSFNLKIKKIVHPTLRAEQIIFIRFVGSKLKYNIFICKLWYNEIDQHTLL